MSASGVTLKDEIMEVFNEFKLKHLYRYLIMGFSQDKKTIELIRKGEREETFEDLLEQLRSASDSGLSRYAVLDFAFTTKDNRKTDKMVCIVFVPDSLPIKEKLLAAASSDALTKKLDNVVKWQVNDFDDLTLEELMQRVL